MLFTLSKAAWFLAEPSNLLVFITAAGLVLLLAGRARKTALTLITAAAFGAIFLGLGPVPSILMSTLEDRFPPFADDGGPVAGVIVLGGSIEPEIAEARDAISVNETAERVIAMADLARRYPAARIVFTGGTSSVVRAGVAEADMVERFESSLGIAKGRVLYERLSRNTIENARLARALALPKPGERWLLVTSAWHMPRSMEIFRREGFPVTAYPVDYRSRGDGKWEMTASVARGLGRSGQALREWAGILALRLGAVVAN